VGLRAVRVGAGAGRGGVVAEGVVEVGIAAAVLLGVIMQAGFQGVVVVVVAGVDVVGLEELAHCPVVPHVLVNSTQLPHRA
jgi:hypothetical protein